MRRFVSVFGAGLATSAMFSTMQARAVDTAPTASPSATTQAPVTPAPSVAPSAGGTAPTPAPPPAAPAPSAPETSSPAPAPAPPSSAASSAPPAQAVQPAAPAPAAPPPASPAVAPQAAAPTTQSDADLRFAFIHLASNYKDTTLELRSFVDANDWRAVCSMPCDQAIDVAGAEARVTAPNMTPSNVFRIEPGRGRALVKVEGGAEGSRSLGLTALIAGIPVSLVGGALFGYGAVEENDALKIGGGITLGLGAAMVLTSLPLLVAGGTDVRDGRGKQIARELPRSSPAVGAF